MAQKKREPRKPYVLWGEGDTEQLFLELFKQYYSKELADKRITVGHGGGGSPGSILEALDKKVLSLGDPKTPTLVLLDEDKGLDKEAKAVLEKYTHEEGCSIILVASKPQCLEGFLLDLLDDLTPPGQHTSEKLKEYFQQRCLGSRQQVTKHFKKKRAELFPKALLDKKMTSHPILRQVSLFLGLIEE
jgi:hypothetical protein